ncbi:hypothetical protein [Miniphocaeibacter halophilus]|uniref:Uncharacterized protein n=1 Tax=Miniphocaeibacter halophilus TaxID=2931922 RepID=A0AC61N0H1_9FIRM|nr:hypothetical protein [Miniphocaeibacter halophilus]QQK08806.1 hypothetical protein JFY71_04540 [Miniphocaeibacter halophilus]
MNLKEYEKENARILPQLKNEYKKEYFKIYNYIDFDDSFNLRKVITENTILKKLLNFQEKGKDVNNEEVSSFLNNSIGIYKNTPKIDYKYRILTLIKFFSLILLAISLASLTINLSNDNDIIKSGVRLYLIYWFVSLFIVHSITKKFTPLKIKKNTLGVILFVIPLALESFLDIIFPLNIFIDFYVFIGITIVSLITFFVSKHYSKKECTSLYSN